MKMTKLNMPPKSIFLGVLITMTMCFFSSCVKKQTFLTSSVVPAARGYAIVKRDNNKNYFIELHLSNLAEVERLQTLKLTYVVWMVTDQDETKNIGQINSSKGFFTKKLKASFETVSSFKPTKIFITAENDPTIQYPAASVVLSTDKF